MLTQNPAKKLIISVIIISLTSLFISCTDSSSNSFKNASYSKLTENEFLKDWAVLGPIEIEGLNNNLDSIVNASFNSNPTGLIKSINSSNLPDTSVKEDIIKWQFISSEQNIIDITKYCGNMDYHTAFAASEIIVEEPVEVILGIGSDDGIKVYLNGTLIHENNISRAVNPDEDIVKASLKKGSNKLLVKIQNQQGGWGFVFRPLGGYALVNSFIKSCSRGKLDEIELLAPYIEDINAIGEAGLTALQTAQVHGREEVIELLKSLGAKDTKEMPAISTVIDSAYSFMSPKTSGAAILVAKNGNVIFSNGYGYADIKDKVKVTPQTIFRIGSVTKQFTAVAILKLLENGKLSLDDKLSKYMPDFPKADSVTIHQLLNHTCGIGIYTKMPNFIKRVEKEISKEELLDIIKSLDYEFSPGTKYNYNNSGYFILGHIIEEVSGISYSEYLENEFFTPLKMSNTGIYDNNEPPKNEAIGYMLEGKKSKVAIDWDMTWAGGAGAIYSTVEDLYKWNEALYNNKVLSEENLKLATSPTILNNGTDTIWYGFGLMLSNNRGISSVGHGGGLSGFLSHLERNVDDSVTVVVLTNSTPPLEKMYPQYVSSQILQYLLWPQMKKQKSYRKPLNITPTKLEDYIGQYDYGTTGILTVKVKNGQLYARLSGQPEFPIFSIDTDHFEWKVVNANVKFNRDSEGKVISATHYQGGGTIRAARISETLPKPAKYIKLNDSVLETYTGKYDYGNGAILVIRLQNSQLFAQLSGQPEFPIYPAAEDEFVWEIVEARVKFNRNNEGVIISGTHNQGGASFEAPKLED